MSILTGQPRMASVVALTRCELLELDRPTLDGITKTHPHVWDVLREFAGEARRPVEALRRTSWPSRASWAGRGGFRLSMLLDRQRTAVVALDGHAAFAARLPSVTIPV